MVTICNKPLLEFMLDFAMLRGCTAVRIIVDEPDRGIESYFAGGERWGVDISYNIAKTSDSIDTIFAKNSAFCRASPLLIIDGFLFVHYDKTKNHRNSFAGETGLLSSCASGSVLFAEDTHCLKNISNASLDQDFALSPLTSLDELFQTTLQVLEAEHDHYVLPGYGMERGILLGRNVEIGREVEIIPPVIVGDNVRLLGKAEIGPNAVIGSNVIIDSGTKVEQSIVLSGSYLGRELTIFARIIAGDRIISPKDGAVLDINEGFLLSPIASQAPGLTSRCVNTLIALLLAGIQAAPYLILAGTQKLQGDWHVEYKTLLLNVEGDSLTLAVPQGRHHSIAGRIFATLGLDKFPLLGAVICGKLPLVGNRLLPDSQRNRELLHEFPHYRPGLFAYSDSEDVVSGTFEEEITERYHAANRGLAYDLRILPKIIWANILKKSTGKTGYPLS
jgi:NDP-sugar pyrophosphorylase family protein